MRRVRLFQADAIVQLSDRDVGQEIVRVHNKRVDRTRSDKQKVWRRDAVVIKNLDTGDWILRVALGSGRPIEGLTTTAVALDYDGQDCLGIRRGQDCRLEVLRATEFDVLSWYWHHADPGLRLSVRLGGLGAVLGVVSLVIGFLVL